MVRQEQFKGKTVDDAVEAGLKEMGLTRDDVEIEVLEEGKKKLIGSIPAVVRITEKEKLTDGQRAVAFLVQLFEKLGIEAVPTLREEEEHIVIDLSTDEPARGLIGRRGEIIDAVQTLAGAVANKGRREYKRVVVDCGNYREDREETLKRLAEKSAAKAVRRGRKEPLNPMPPYERRIIHAALVDNPDVTTKSEGKEPARYVVIIPNNMRPYEKRDRYNNRRDRGGYGGNKGGNKRGQDDRKDKYGDRNRNYKRRELPTDSAPATSGTSLNRSGSGFRKGGFSGFFGTYLGNSRDGENVPETDLPETAEQPETAEGTEATGTAFRKDED